MEDAWRTRHAPADAAMTNVDSERELDCRQLNGKVDSATVALGFYLLCIHDVNILLVVCRY